MSVINDEDDLEAEALDLYKRCMARLFGQYLDDKAGLLGVEGAIEEFAHKVEDRAARMLAGSALVLISNFREEAGEIMEEREPDPENPGSKVR